MTYTFAGPPAATVFTTVHGSHLYGLNHEGSDLDIFTITTSPAPKARQGIRDNLDTATVGFETFLRRATTGSHQSAEALFSPYKQWHSHTELAPFLDGLRIGGGAVAAKYERTIRSFTHGDFKKRRHAARLALNLDQLRRFGRFTPVLTESEKAYINEAANLTEERLLDALFNYLPSFPPAPSLSRE